MMPATCVGCSMFLHDLVYRVMVAGLCQDSGRGEHR